MERFADRFHRGPGRPDKFTERARRVFKFADGEVQRFSHEYIGTEHLLLGVVREGDGLAAKVLNNLGGDLAILRTKTEELIAGRDATTEKGLTGAARRAIELSIDEARRLDHHYIGTEHLLLGLAREGGLAAQALQSLGIDLEKIRAETTRILSQSARVRLRADERRPTLPPYYTESAEGRGAVRAMLNWRRFFDDPKLDKEAKDKYVGVLNDLLKQAQEEYNTPAADSQP